MACMVGRGGSSLAAQGRCAEFQGPTGGGPRAARKSDIVSGINHERVEKKWNVRRERISTV